jgi:PAS domain S-box-containing protein
MLHADLSSRGKLYGKIKYEKQNGKFRFTYYDENICKMLGYSPRELIGKDAFVILHPADKNIMMQRAKDRMQGKEVENEYLTRLKRKDGTYVLVKVVGASPNISK